MAFDKAKFLAPAQAPETETVTVPGFGPVMVRGLTGDEYDRFEAACTQKAADGKAEYKTDRPLLVKMAAIDPDTGFPLFGDDDLPALRAKPAKALIPVAKAAFRLSGAGEDAAGN